MLAEVGLPPGAEVDRASLEAAKQSGEGMSSYEVLPDRVEFHIWPTAGGSKFEFGFRVRYGMESWERVFLALRLLQSGSGGGGHAGEILHSLISGTVKGARWAGHFKN
jgi:hypothetical protein